MFFFVLMARHLQTSHGTIACPVALQMLYNQLCQVVGAVDAIMPSFRSLLVDGLESYEARHSQQPLGCKLTWKLFHTTRHYVCASLLGI